MDLEQVAVPPASPDDYEPEFLDEEEPAEISSFVLGREKVDLGRLKAQLVELASLQVSHCFRSEGVEVSEEEIQQIAAMQVELGSVDLIEIFSPSRFTKRAARFGVRPGFAVDLLERKPYGEHAGEFWDLLKESDIKELDELIDYEKPKLTGSPPCDPFSALLNISKYRCNPKRREASFERGKKHLHTSVRFYRKQYVAGRYFCRSIRCHELG